jgi:hypothetical protein
VGNSESINANETRYTELEATRKLGFKNRLTLWRWRKRGAIGYYLIGRQIWYGEHHLRDFLARCERKPKATKGVI